MSQSFFMRIDFIVNIACLLKLSINYWNSFDLPSHSGETNSDEWIPWKKQAANILWMNWCYRWIFTAYFQTKKKGL
jgi:hypothetical protein